MSQAALDAAKFAKMLYQRGLGADQRGPADDFFNAASGAETFMGGTGNDTVSYYASTAGVTARLYDGIGMGGYAQGDRYFGIENLIGSKYNDTLGGDSNANILIGLEGNDTINGGGGGDRLYGDAGRDWLIASGRAGLTELMDGGADNDKLTFYTMDGAANITTGTGIDAVEIFITDANHFHVEINDFQPYFEGFGSTITTSEFLTGDQLYLKFNSTLGTNLGQVAAFQQVVNGNDLSLVFNNPTVHGEIVLKNVGQFMDIAGTSTGYNFNIDGAFYTAPQPV